MILMRRIVQIHGTYLLSKIDILGNRWTITTEQELISRSLLLFSIGNTKVKSLKPLEL
jgi:hypothetical protein